MSIKVIRLPKDKMSAPAFTNGLTIFITQNIKNYEFELLYKHEVGHILLEHIQRTPKNLNNETIELWELATELEIARNLYDKEDLEIIDTPFSILNDGVKPDSIPKLPKELLIAEDIYEWLLKNQEKSEQKCCMSSKLLKEKIKQQIEKQTGKSISKEEVTKLIEDVKSEIKKTLNNGEVDYKIKTIKTTKKPTLSSEIDYILRHKNKRKRTYSRESRVVTKEFLLKGRKTIKKSPKIEIFVDRSGSFQGSRTKKSLDVIKLILKKYNVKITSDFFYFSNGNLYDHDVPANGGNPYPLVMNHLKVSKPKIAIILTDGDIEGDLKPLSHKGTTILCIPIECSHTRIAPLIGGKDVAIT